MTTGTPRPSSSHIAFCTSRPLSPSDAKRAGGAGELADEDPRAELLQPLGMAVEHGEPDRGLVAEGDGQRLLQMGASGHRRVAMALRRSARIGAASPMSSLDQRQAVAHLKDDGACP